MKEEDNRFFFSSFNQTSVSVGRNQKDILFNRICNRMKQGKKKMLAVLVLFDFQLQIAVGISKLCSFTHALYLKFSFFHLISFNSQHIFCADLLQSKTRGFLSGDDGSMCRKGVEIKNKKLGAGRHVDDRARQSSKRRGLLKIVPVTVL